MPKLLTAKPLDANKLATEKAGTERREIRDSGSRGLSFIIQPSGARSWALRLRHNDKRHKIHLGAYPDLSLSAARDKARDYRADPGKAIDREQAPADAGLVSEAWARFVALHLSDRNLVRESSARRFQQLFESNVLPRWKARKLRDIAKRDVIEILDTAQKRGISARNSTRTVLSSFFNWAVGRDLINESPLAGVKKLEEKSRERVLSDDELRTIWHGCDRLGFVFGPMFQLLMLTGARRDEVAGMEWAELDLQNRLWTTGRTKTDREHTVYLSDQALTIIESLPRLADCRYVFSTTGDSPSSGFSKAKALLDKIALTGKPWRLHDLRRTFTTNLVPLGVSEITIEKCLNHTLKGVMATYNRHPYTAEKQKAWEIWGAHVARIVSGKTASHVVPMVRA